MKVEWGGDGLVSNVEVGSVEAGCVEAMLGQISMLDNFSKTVL